MNFLQKIELAFYRIIVKVYRLPDDPVSQCDVIVPHCYALLKNGDLADATLKTVTEATALGEAFPHAIILIPTVNYFGEEARRQENALKLAMIERSGIKNRIIVIDQPCNNSAFEVRYALVQLQKEKIACRDFAVICDAPHMRSIRLIWAHYSKGSEIRVSLKSVDARWFQPHYIFFQRSPFRWLAANFTRHLYMRVFGVDRAAAIQFKK